VLVTLGPHRFEVGDRALVVAAVDDVEQAVADGADVVAVADPSTVDVDVPVVALADVDPPPEGEREAVLARQALAITRGARVVVTTDVRGTRRVADVLAAILAAA
jgi:dihydropteroate synthase